MMASKKFFIDEEELCCAICLDLWIEKDNRVLPCQHTFCLECLENISNNSIIKCPTCTKSFISPIGGAVNLPKNPLKHALQKDVNKEKLCTKHEKTAITPIFVCSTCREENICEDCFQLDHSPSKCKLISLNHLEQNNTIFRNECQNILDEQMTKEEENKMRLHNYVIELKNECLAKIDKVVNKLEDEIIRFYEYKMASLMRISEKLNDKFVDESKIKEDIKELSYLKLIEDNSPIISIDCRLIRSNSKKDITKIHKVNTFEILMEKFFLTDEGLYELLAEVYLKDENQLSMIYFRERNDSEPKVFFLDKLIMKFVVTDRNIYALSAIDGSLLKCSKADHHQLEFDTLFDSEAKMKVIDEKTFSYFDKTSTKLFATEDKDNHEYVLTYETFDINVIFFFEDNSLKWTKKIFNHVENFCLMGNGSIVTSFGNQLTILDKNSGKDLHILKLNNFAISTICYLKTGNLIIQTDELSELKLFTNDLKFRQNLHLHSERKCKGVTKSGLLCLNSSVYKNVIHLYKLI
ncbi:unnamed protein product [Dimorphilus gyrociliatus]|uniref:RING-type domain-containing protein n=1 Tax=Dimorphilus gyrociliatus TaxID=2664684 RepID=A0A7I8VG12_9ANNE|nr:unnamed protein product [Dimorphilus gyrociliatus]